jgi:hypothetical protein
MPVRHAAGLGVRVLAVFVSSASPRAAISKFFTFRY